MSPQIAPHGSWKSPISADAVAAGVIGLGQVALDGEDIYWVEMRPQEGGRNVIVRCKGNGETTDVTPPPFNARTRANEYGGGDFAVLDGTVYFSNFADQQLYRQGPGTPPQAITATPRCRYADTVVDARRRRLICVCEDHRSGAPEPVNTLISLTIEGDGDMRVLAQGRDFYSSPRLSPDGSRLAWLSWNHPNMPWDGTELWVAAVTAAGRVERPRHVAGGATESIFQPEWSPDGVLHFISDRSGWWNLYRWHNERIEPLCEMAAECGRPQWVFAMSTYGFESHQRLICSYGDRGTWSLARLDTAAHALEAVPSPYADVADIRIGRGRVAFRGGSPAEGAAIVRLDLQTGQCDVLRRSSVSAVDPGYLSMPEAIEFPTQEGLTAHALFYRPRNRDCAAPTGEQPPLLVRCHGGPTAAASSTLDLKIQYWTSRGIAVLDVNYGGSSGYGRAYRQRLEGRWGIVDVDDCVNGARFLVARGDVDDKRLAITGGSAGGYTALCALTFRRSFKAGASYYGISDLEALAKDTHKFELHYTDRLVGPYPECAEMYRQRSPLHFADGLTCPVIFFQGLDDKVVPPSQTEAMVAALRSKGLPVAYVAFAGEQHGFRRAENIKRALEAELYFYSRIFQFPAADVLPPVAIENLDSGGV
ncbi:MAG: S9 family peptidase [Candidatus Binatia bacterium]